MRLRIGSLMKLVAIVALDFGIVAWLRRDPIQNDPLSLLFELLLVVFLFATTPILVMASWPGARQTED